jgi:hypothetical protein
MCKVIGFTNFQKVREKLGAIEYFSQLLLATERDGFGYAVWDNNKKASFGERTTENTFTSLARPKLDVNFSFCEEPYMIQNSFGEFDLSSVGPAVFHGRVSTNNKNIQNTHPMVKNGWSLIHNGVVTDHGPNYQQETTNDSEHVLTRYVDGTFEKALTGYYAFLAIDPEGKLHVGKDNIARLHSTWVAALDSYIFSTNEENIKAICKAFSVSHSPILKVKDDRLVIFNGNEVVETRRIASRGHSWKEAQHAQKSLGHSIHGYNQGGANPKTTTTTLTTTTKEITGTSGKVVSLVKGYTKKEERKKDLQKAYRSLTLDEEAFIHEVAQMDGSYTVINPKGKKVRIETFKELDFSQQMYFEVIRPDGTIVDWVDYSTDKLSRYNT